MKFPDDSRALAFKTLAALLVVWLAGCASVPPDRGTGGIDEMLAVRGLPAPAWEPDASRSGIQDAGTGEFTLARALLTAFERNPGIRRRYAELGIAQAEVVEASRLAFVRFDFSSIRGDGERQVKRGITIPFTGLLMLPLERRLAREDFRFTRLRVTASLVELAAEVETAWYDYVSAQQIADMRALVARAAETSAELADRLRQAGNISPRNHALERAAASDARIASARAAAETARARAALANLLAIPVQGDWTVPKLLPAVPVHADSFPDVEAVALSNRLDLQAAQEEAEAAERKLGLLKALRWLGVIEAGAERESEGGATKTGPTFGWELPLFHWNRGGILRQTAALETARAELAALEFSIRNDLSLALNELETARAIAESYRTELLPHREAVVGTTFEELNYMLTDAFELLQAKREQYEAYGEYLEAVRAYWVARSTLRKIAGGRLPGDRSDIPGTIGVDPAAVTPTPSSDDSTHHGHTP